MNLTRPARCLFCSFSRAASVGPRVPRRQFHPSPTQFNRKPKFPSVKESDMKSLHEIARDIKPDDFKGYTEEEKARLREVYTPEQMEAIEAGEKAIDPKDLAEQYGFRQDPMKLNYFDDFSVIEPGVDKPVRAPYENTDYNARLKTSDEFDDDFARYFTQMPENASAADWLRFVETLQVTTGKPEHEFASRSSMAPELFPIGETLEENNKPVQTDITGIPKSKGQIEMPEGMEKLLQATGFTYDYVRSLRTKVLVSHSVTNQTRMGKIRSQYVLAVAGNGNGMLGIGEAKSEEVSDASAQARYRAIRNMQPIPRYEGRTIYGDVEGKVGAVELKLMNRPPGFGIRCQHLIFEMCRAGGIYDLAARVSRSRNPMNTVKAAYQAIMSQRDPEEIARARGKKFVDVRKVYYSGRI